MTDTDRLHARIERLERALQAAAPYVSAAHEALHQHDEDEPAVNRDLIEIYHALAREGEDGPNVFDDRIAELEMALTAYTEFFKNLCGHFWSRGLLTMDGGEFQDLAEMHRLIRKTSYDPERHGPNLWGVEPGASWYEPTNLAMTMERK